jgi:hypothetical protein
MYPERATVLLPRRKTGVDRLTHPKKNTDMNVSDAELTSLHEAVRWYFNAAVTVLNNKTFWAGPTIPPFPG